LSTNVVQGLLYEKATTKRAVAKLASFNPDKNNKITFF
jgi:hypothetical protein